MSNQIPVKPINEIEVKSEVSENDKILILDSESEEARLASKEELKGDTWATITSAAFVWDDIVFTKDDSDTVTLENAKSELEWPKGDKWDKWDTWEDDWEYMTQSQYDALTPEQKADWKSRAIYTDQEFYFKTLLRAADNLLHYNEYDELYADLQLQNWMTPTSSFPTWVVVGNVSSTDWWSQNWVLVNAKTTDWHYVRWLCWANGKLFYDDWNGVFKEFFTSDDISSVIDALRTELSEVAFTGKSSDLDNDAEFTADKVMTMEEYEQTPWTAGDDKNYWIFEEEN